MSCLHYQQDELYIENVRLQSVADQFGTPCYVYSKAAIENNWRAFDQAFHAVPHRLCYAVKANSNLAILRYLPNSIRFDIVSIGELKRVIAITVIHKNFFSVGKSAAEIEFAIKKIFTV